METETEDPREKRLREIAGMMSAARDIEAERNALLRELSAELGRGKLAYLARISGLTKGRVHQIVSTDG